MRALVAGFAMAWALCDGSAWAGTITGTVSWATPRTATPIRAVRDGHVCGVSEPLYEREVVVDGGGHVEGALVYLEPASLPRRTNKRTVTVDQRNCRFVPRLMAATVGSSLRFSNSDPVLHNVHVKDGAGRTVANFAMPIQNQVTPPIRLSKPGLFSVRCEAGHTWMASEILVLAHPWFALTQNGGGYLIRGAPPGKHRLVVFHPDIGRVEREVVIGPGASSTTVDLAF